MSPTLADLDAILTKHEDATSAQALALFLDVVQWRDAFAGTPYEPNSPVVAPAPVVRAPEVVVEDDGDVCIDFDHARDNVVSILLHPDGTWGWSAVVGSQAECARGTPLPAWVLAALSPRETPDGGGR